MTLFMVHKLGGRKTQVPLYCTVRSAYPMKFRVSNLITGIINLPNCPC